jgi:hypothetical protein
MLAVGSTHAIVHELGSCTPILRLRRFVRDWPRRSRCCSPGDGICSIHPSLRHLSKFTRNTANKSTVLPRRIRTIEVYKLPRSLAIPQTPAHSFRSKRKQSSLSCNWTSEDHNPMLRSNCQINPEHPAFENLVTRLRGFVFKNAVHTTLVWTVFITLP